MSLTDPGVAPPPTTAPLFSATLWPHRPLSRRSFALILLAATLGFAVPMIPLLGTAALWFVGAFVLIDLAALALTIQLTYRSGRVRETVEIWPDRIAIARCEPSGRERRWEANPHWVKLRLIDTRRIESYLVLSSAGREVELGAFLTPEERRELAATLSDALARARVAGV